MIKNDKVCMDRAGRGGVNRDEGGGRVKGSEAGVGEREEGGVADPSIDFVYCRECMTLASNHPSEGSGL